MPLSDLWGDAARDAPPELNAAPPVDERSFRIQLKMCKARAALAVKRERARLEQEYGKDDVDMDIESKRAFQHQFLASASLQWDPFEATDPNCGEFEAIGGRKRAVYLYFKSLAVAVKNMFQWKKTDADLDLGVADVSCQETQPINHLISMSTNDDTNIKLGSGIRGGTEVRSVMNNIQEHVVVTEGTKQKWFPIHQPIVALDRANTLGLYQAFMSWVLGFAGYVGWRLRPWGIPSDILKTVRNHTFIFVGDALPVNTAVCKFLTQCLQRPGPTQSTVLQIQCNIHQVSLTRKTVVLGFGGYWSTLVRMGHLWESHTFRQRFQACMAKIIQENFQYIRVQSLPPEAFNWSQRKIDSLRMYLDIGHQGCGGSRGNKRDKPSTRLKVLVKLCQKDNGDNSTDSFTHFCTGDDCCPNGPSEALSDMLSSYLQLFAHPPVPLLYRWKHAAAASNFVRDGFFWHKVLPRTFEAMPTLKCALSNSSGGFHWPG